MASKFCANTLAKHVGGTPLVGPLFCLTWCSKPDLASRRGAGRIDPLLDKGEELVGRPSADWAAVDSEFSPLGKSS